LAFLRQAVNAVRQLFSHDVLRYMMVLAGGTAPPYKRLSGALVASAVARLARLEMPPPAYYAGDLLLI
jgi:hypothetical protein